MSFHEIDLPPVAFLDIQDNDSGFTRVIPRVIAVLGDNREQVAAAGYSIINAIMQKMDAVDGIIWWRSRPVVEDSDESCASDGGLRPQFEFRARIATSPELPDEFWEPITHKEGEPTELTPEVLYRRARLAADPLDGSDLDYGDLYQDYIRYIGGRCGSDFVKDPHTADMTKILSAQPVVPNMAGEQPERPSLVDIQAASAALRASLPKIKLKKTRRRASRRARRPSKGA